MSEKGDQLKGYAWIVFAFFLGIAICILAAKV